jgi:hypothetical protein
MMKDGHSTCILPVDVRLGQGDPTVVTHSIPRSLSCLGRHSRACAHASWASHREIDPIVASSYSELPGVGDRGLQQLPKDIDIVFIVGLPQMAAHRSLQWYPVRWELCPNRLALVHLAVASSDTAYLKARKAKAGWTVFGDEAKERAVVSCALSS